MTDKIWLLIDTNCQTDIMCQLRALHILFNSCLDSKLDISLASLDNREPQN